MQTELFHEDWRDALQHVIKALGGYEAVGADLWPGKTRKAAGSWLSDCLNGDRPAKLDLEEIALLLRMARDRGVHVGIHFLCDVAGYGRPNTVEPEDQEAEVARQMERCTGELKALLKTYDRIAGAKALRSVS